MEIRGGTFLVTGGSSGLGGAAATLLVKRGANVLIADVNAAAGELLADRLGAAARFVCTDVTSAAEVQGAVDAAIARYGVLNGLVNCAGIALAGRVLGKEGPHPLEKFAKVLEVNLVGAFNAIRLAAAAMALNAPNAGGERGVIVNTASIAAYDGQIGQAAYAASKGGIVALTLPLARDLAQVGIRVMTIAPGIFDTPLLGSLPEAARQSLGEQVPFPARLGEPAEFAALVAHIVENAMLNGEVIRLDGGLRMGPR